MRFAIPIAALCLAGCGYVGDPLPPALHIAGAVRDLAAVQRGDKIEIAFTAPARTTDDIPIREFESVELRIGTVPGEFSFDSWAAGARLIDLPLPVPGKAVSVSVAALEWTGRQILLGVRFQERRGRPGGWSNTVLLTPRPALAVPALKAELHPEGIRLTWAGSTQVRLFKANELITVASGAEHVDRAVELGKSYSYTAQSIDGEFESVMSGPVEITMRDGFAPAAPKNLTAAVGVESVELSWDPSPEADVAGYRVYRDDAVIADGVEGPAFSDRTAPSGTHRYKVLTIDRSGNASAASDVMQITK